MIVIFKKVIVKKDALKQNLSNKIEKTVGRLHAMLSKNA